MKKRSKIRLFLHKIDAKLGNIIDAIYYKIYFFIHLINLNLFEHQFIDYTKKIISKYNDTHYLRCKICKINIEVEINYNLTNNKNYYKYRNNQNYEEVKLTCNETIIKNLLE